MPTPSPATTRWRPGSTCATRGRSPSRPRPSRWVKPRSCASPEHSAHRGPTPRPDAVASLRRRCGARSRYRDPPPVAHLPLVQRRLRSTVPNADLAPRPTSRSRSRNRPVAPGRGCRLGARVHTRPRVCPLRLGSGLFDRLTVRPIDEGPNGHHGCCNVRRQDPLHQVRSVNDPLAVWSESNGVQVPPDRPDADRGERQSGSDRGRSAPRPIDTSNECRTRPRDVEGGGQVQVLE